MLKIKVKGFRVFLSFINGIAFSLYKKILKYFKNKV